MPASTARPRIGLVIDHPDRDLPTVGMLSLALAKRGCTTSIIPLYEQGVDVPMLRLDAIVTTFARPANRALVERYKAMGMQIFVLDTEGGILANDGPNSPETLAKFVRDGEWARLIDGYFFWGTVLRDAFASVGALAPDRLHLTGCPRFDPAAPQWRAMLTSSSRDYILVNTAFPIVNSRFTTGGIDRDAMVEAGWRAEYVDDLIEDSRLAIGRMVELVRRLASHFGDRQFLLRPHPFENFAFYRQAFADRSNVTVNGEGSVLNVIANASCVIQLNCSTAIEALMLDKLPISPDFISTPRLRDHSRLPNLASLQATAEDELIEMIANLGALERTFDFEERYHRLAEPYFYARDGLAAERVADVLAGVPVGQRRIRLDEALRSSSSAPRVTQVVQSVLAATFGSHFTGKLRRLAHPRRRAKLFTLARFRHFLSSAVAVSGDPLPQVRHHRNPNTGCKMASLRVSPVKS